MGKYDHIIDLPHHEPVTRPRMSSANRAAQFAPFAALTGYDEAVEETARLTDSRQELSETDADALNRSLAHIEEQIESRPSVRISFFVPDEKKEGGSYQVAEVAVKRIDHVYKQLYFMDGRVIRIEDIRESTIR